jgi:hypothetical protein
MQIYLPLWQTGTRSASVVVRSTLSPERVASVIRKSVRNLDPGLAVTDLRTIQELVAGATAERRFQSVSAWRWEHSKALC